MCDDAVLKNGLGVLWGKSRCEVAFVPFVA